MNKKGKGKNTKWKDNNTISNQLCPNKTTNQRKKYEVFNVVSETGDSIYSPPFEELTAVAKERSQIFISEDIIEEIVNRIIDHRWGPLLKNKNDNS